MPRTSTSRRSAAGDLRWISLLSAATVALYLCVAWLTEPVDWVRATAHTRVVLTLGYGHLLASVATRPPAGRAATDDHGRRLLALAALLLAYAAYVPLARTWPAVPLALLGVSAWHTFENDLALRRGTTGRSDASGPLRAISPRPRDHAVVAGWMLASGAALFWLPGLVPGVHASDVIAAFALHHLVSWLVFSLVRGARRVGLRATWLRLVRLHLPMAAACLAAMAALERPALRDTPLSELATLLLSPATYLFWSAAHVVHTAWRRGVGAPVR